jgi:hypothetical protein
MVSDGCEVHVAVDVSNCGGCGFACSSNHATPSCVSGTCSVSCNTGFANCNNNAADGCEVNIAADANNCGVCGTVCAVPHATAGCASGACTIAACSAGYADCNNSAVDGCEVNIATDVNNCGGCATVCTVPANATGATCSAGVCGMGACSVGWANCNFVTTDGCETNLLTSTIHCGLCGNVCASGHSCVNGTCN